MEQQDEQQHKPDPGAIARFMASISGTKDNPPPPFKPPAIKLKVRPEDVSDGKLDAPVFLTFVEPTSADELAAYRKVKVSFGDQDDRSVDAVALVMPELLARQCLREIEGVRLTEDQRDQFWKRLRHATRRMLGAMHSEWCSGGKVDQDQLRARLQQSMVLD